ncbi:AtpZ/AtpI family protein [Peribacillus saganii]|uniref:AtpZ/AtpI family protein n=1 Tax=Peribacillus saganii TaxID=2303992 RepID=A0A372LTJ3_9BACI|nr:AtpZ/AtpI family protein [Peribacillus saganii]RFU70874.1 AtpZ/AtpI family protein [Peribacillus saganii]
MRKKDRHLFRAMALTSAILSQLVGCTLVGLFAGRWVDSKLGSAPFLLVIGLLLGLAAGTFAMLRTVRQYFSGD